MIDIDNIEKMLAEISDPPWEFDDEDGSIDAVSGGCVGFVQPHGNLHTIIRTGEEFSHADGRFIAVSPTIVKELLNEVKRLRGMK